MEKFSTSRFPVSRWSLGDLSTEIITLIFKTLRDIDARSLAPARLLSRRISAIVTPIQFEFLRLTEDIISPQAEVYHQQGLQYLYAYTRHVEVRNDLDPERIKYVIDRIQRLISIRWRYIRSDFRAGASWLPSDILSPQHANTKLYIEDLPLRDPVSGSPHDAYLRAIPTGALVSLKTARPAPPLVAHLEPLKRLLLACPRLETLHYHDRGQGGRFSFAPGERLPALTELSLRSYDWDHGPAAAREHWDFSRLRRLSLVDVPAGPFLAAVVPAHPGLAARLESLRCEGEDAPGGGGADATRALRGLVAAGSRLRSLRLVCHVRLLAPAAPLLRPHAPALRALSLRDHVGFGDEARPCPTLAARDVAALAADLRALRELELDWDVPACDDPAAFLGALCAFPRLHTLVLHTQTVVRPSLDDDEEEDEGEEVVDRDYEAAVRTLSFLVQGKAASSSDVVPWRSITINVGGWRHAMVRRTSAPWRERNMRGVYAERCFVLERQEGAGAGGEMVMREERAVET
ncbi:hypothetical protein F4809DRAFT_652563 [Biscogniauxia mediterranea]|nr:hypothetical protein F4809DRAFT_652563 [Biscogniauxia mediterranea]